MTDQPMTAPLQIDTRDDVLQDVLEIDRQASVWMKRGMALARDGAAPALEEALACFQEAIALRGRIPLDTFPAYRYGLAACWLNRGEALAALGGAQRLERAIEAYDIALSLLVQLPIEHDPRVRRRLAIAWQNKGLALQAQGHIDEPDGGALQAFQRATDLIDDEAVLIDDRDYMRAAICTNLANAFLAIDDGDAATTARGLAHRVIELTANRTEDSLDLSVVAITARHVLCQAITRLLIVRDNAASRDFVRELVNEATDAVDDGLSIARRWEQRGVDRLRGLAYDLVRFGARVYATYQPQFLSEFVQENFDPARSLWHYVCSVEMRAAAIDSLWLSFRAHRP